MVKETIQAVNPDTTVNPYRTSVVASNIMELVVDYDFILDDTDNFPAKFLVSDTCALAKKPFPHAGIIRFRSQLMAYTPGRSPYCCYVFKGSPPENVVPIYG